MPRSSTSWPHSFSTAMRCCLSGKPAWSPPIAMRTPASVLTGPGSPWGCRSVAGTVRSVDGRSRAAAGHAGDAAAGRRPCAAGASRASTRAASGSRTRRPTPASRCRTGSRPTPGSRTPSSEPPRPEAFVEPRELEPEQRALYRAAVRGLPRRRSATGPGRVADLGWRTALAELGVDLVGDLGVALELARRRAASCASSSSAAAAPARRCSTRSSCGARWCAPRSGRPTQLAHRRRRRHRAGDRQPHARSRRRARRGRARGSPSASSSCKQLARRRPRRARAPTARAARSSPGCRSVRARDRDDARSCSDIVSLTPSNFDDFVRCARALLSPAAARRAGERRRLRRTTRACSCTTCCGAIHAGGSCHDAAHVADVLAGHGADNDARARARRPARAAVPVGRRRRGPRTSTTLARFHRLPPPMFMATARIDAVWIHDGLLDARDYKTGRLWHDARRRRPGRQGAGVRARARPRATAACGCGCATSTCSPRSTTTPSRGSPTTTTSRRSRRSCAPRSSAMWDDDDWRGVADADVCRTCRVPLDLSRQRGAGRAGVAGAGAERRRRTARTGRVRADGRSPRARSSSASARRRNACRPTTRAAADRPARRRGARAPRPTRARASCSRRVDIVAVVADRVVALPRSRARCSRAGSASRRARPRSRRSAATARSCSSTSSPTRIQRGELRRRARSAAPRAMHTRWRARREPRVELTWETGDDAPCEWVIGDDRPGASDYEMAHTARSRRRWCTRCSRPRCAPTAGRSVDEHQRHVSELWARFAAVAADNPNAWSRTAYSPEEIRTVSPDNRMVCFPYPKRMCANIDVDQGAALLLCSYEAARAAGVPDDRMVFLHAAAEAHDHYFVTERGSLADSPGDRGRRSATRSTRPAVGVDDVARFDLYSCFPSAVQIAMRALGLADDDPRPLTVTGGLGFAGGPVNNYPTHAIARMVEVLRADPGELRLHDRARLVRHEARGRRLVGAAARRRLPARRSARRRQARGRRAAAPRAGRAGRRRRRRRSDVGRVRARRHARARHRDRAASTTAGGPSRRAATPTSCGRSPRNHGKGGACASRTGRSTNDGRRVTSSDGRSAQPRRRCCGGDSPGAAPAAAAGNSSGAGSRWSPDCPRCGLHFEREQGYWAGALAINTDPRRRRVRGRVRRDRWSLTIPDIPVAPLLAVCVPIVVIGPIVAYPFSKTIWVAVDRAFLQRLDGNEGRDEQVRRI